MKLEALEKHADLPYRLTIIGNAAPNSSQVAQRSKAPRSPYVETLDLGMAWPHGIYSLAHVAIPFALDDPVYGAGENPGTAYKGVPFGKLQPRGETKYLTVPLSQLMRLRYNPFFSYVEERIIETAEFLIK